jgi:hypothetical protein
LFDPRPEILTHLHADIIVRFSHQSHTINVQAPQIFRKESPDITATLSGKKLSQ